MPKAPKTKPQPPISRAARRALELLGSEIRKNRKLRKMTEADLALRIGRSRDTVRAIEAGAPTVAAGATFEAAAVLGIDLFGGDGEVDRRLSENRMHLSLLPERVRTREQPFDDNF